MGKNKLGFHFDQSDCAIMVHNLCGSLKTNLRREPPKDHTLLIVGLVATGLALIMVIAFLIGLRIAFREGISTRCLSSQSDGVIQNPILASLNFPPTLRKSPSLLF